MNLPWRASLERALGSKVARLQSVTGGDICRAYLARLEDGREIFVKSLPEAPSGMFETEALGLQWLAQRQSLTIPAVLACSRDFLALEYLASGSRRATFEAELGQGLAQLHGREETDWGWPEDNYIGTLPQANPRCEDWSQFYAEARLRPLLHRAAGLGLTRADWPERFERVFRELPRRLPEEAPARLHGDLWSGNLGVGPTGKPCLFDPAAYVGSREVDLAMMRLFGGFGPRVFEAYEATCPLPEGHSDRVDLYQLYPLLVHLNLFGKSYAEAVEGRLRRWEMSR